LRGEIQICNQVSPSNILANQRNLKDSFSQLKVTLMTFIEKELNKGHLKHKFNSKVTRNLKKLVASTNATQKHPFAPVN
jgi:hypothetical protein